MKLPIYMDHHATTPVDPRVLEAMLPYFSEKFGNPASVTHSMGWDAQEAVEKARSEIAAAIGADPKEIIFTSGATEADNLALKGAAEAYASRGRHLVVSSIEHNAVLDCARRLEKGGFKVTYVPVDAGGIVDPEDVRSSITPETILVSVMTANNEIGTIQPIREIGAITRERGVIFHTDAAQAAGKLPLNVVDDMVDLVTFSAHKMYGPKGIGALYVRRSRPRVRLISQVDGGGHEQGLRSGTLPVPLIIGFAAALRLSLEVREGESERLGGLRDRLWKAIADGLEGVCVNGSMEHRLPHNLNLAFDGIDAESVLTSIKEVALSSGSACTSAEVEPSHVLKAIGLPDQLASGSIRFGLGRSNSVEEIDFVASRIIETVKRLRQLAPGRPTTAGTGP